MLNNNFVDDLKENILANFIPANRSLSRVFGAEISGFIGCLVNHRQIQRDKGMLEPDGFFHMANSEVYYHTGFSDGKQQRLVQKMESNHLVTTTMKYYPTRKMYSLNDEVIMSVLANVKIMTDIDDKPPKKEVEKHYLTCEQFNHTKSVVDIWNSIEGVSKHQLPDSFEEPVSKTVLKISNYIEHLQKGDFVSKTQAHIGIDGFEYNTPLNLLTIKSVVSRFAERFCPSFLPVNKKSLPTSLPSFFVAYQTKFSTFFHVLKEGNKKRDGGNAITTKVAGNIEDIIKQAIFDKFNRKIQGGTISDLATKDVESRVFNCEKIHKELVDTLNTLYYGNTNYKKQIQNFSFFMNNFYVFFDTQYSGLPMDITKLWFNKDKSRTYQKFIAWIKHQYGIILYPTSEEITAIEARRDLAMGKAEEPSIEEILAF